MQNLTNASAIVLGYAMSGLSFFKEIDIDNFEINGIISVLSFLVASLVSASVAYKNYQDAKFREAERHKLEQEISQDSSVNR